MCQRFMSLSNYFVRACIFAMMTGAGLNNLHAQSLNAFLPLQLKTCLDSSRILDRYSLGVKGVRPTWIRGDFYGDGARDYAVILSDKNGTRVNLAAIAFCRAANLRAEIFGPNNIADVDKRGEPFRFKITKWGAEYSGSRDEVHLLFQFGDLDESSDGGESGEELVITWSNDKGLAGYITGG